MRDGPAHGAAGGGAGLCRAARRWRQRGHARGGEQRSAARQRGDQLDLGDRRGAARHLHAGGLRLPGDRLLARRRTPARSSRRSSPTSRSPRSCTGPSASPSPSAIGDDHRPRRLLPARLRRSADGRSRSWASPTPRSRRSGSSSSSFCAVSLAIVWGTTLERIKFGVYIIYAIVFAGFIYPIASHWVFGGGWLQANLGMQDFAGSTAVHLIGATGALAVLLLLGAAARQVRAGRRAAGDPRAQHAALRPRRADPVARLVRVQPGLDARRAGRALPRGRARDAARRRGRRARRAIAHRGLEDGHDRHRHGRQRRDRRAGGHHRAVGLRRARGRRRSSARSPASSSRSASTRSTRRSTTRSARCPRTAWPASGARSRAACSRRRGWPSTTAFGEARPDLHAARSTQLGTQALGVVVVFTFVFALSFATFCAIKKTYGLRVTAEEEDAGLDISEHGMYGYPEQFIPAPELIGYSRRPAARPRETPARRHHQGGPRHMKKIEAFIRHEAFEPIRMELLEPRLPLALDHRRSRARGARRASPSATAAPS